MGNKILIIDDDRDVVTTLQTLLEFHHYTAIGVTSAKDGLSKISEFYPDVVVLDWQMPDMSGIDILQIVHKELSQRQPYIIMVSGRASTDDIVAGLDTGADDYLPKPFKPEELLARIRVGIRVKSLEQRIAEDAEKAALLQMALSVADSIGNQIAAAKLHIDSIRQNTSFQNNDKSIQSTLEAVYELLSNALILISKYQAITSTHSIPPPAGSDSTVKS
ncbi:MAG TPA: response regulator transcription factor [Bacteroidota bacterium]|nr:response regulator transcription factor [Bacteroidota bacterium]